MTDILSLAYKEFDNAVMYGVNKGFKAWNWTTGQTKTDLACDLHKLGSIGISAGSWCFNDSGLVGTLFTFGSLLTSHRTEQNFRDMEKKETKAVSDGMIDLKVEDFNKKAGYTGVFNLVVGLAQYFVLGKAIERGEIKDGYQYLMPAGFCLWSAANYVVRADNLPPRRNVLSRAKEGLLDKINNSRPSLVPA